MRRAGRSVTIIGILTYFSCISPSFAAEQERGMLGVRIQAGTRGVRVVEVLPDLGAEAAGIGEGDLLLSLREDRPGAGTVTLSGLGANEARDHLRGETGSRVHIMVDPFPPGGETREILVERKRPDPDRAEAEPGARKESTPLSAAQREANLFVAALRGDRDSDLNRALSAWEAEQDVALLSDVLLDLLEDLDGLGWLKKGVSTSRRDDTWARIGKESRFLALFERLPPPVRLKVAGLLALHRGSSEAALGLLRGIPESAGEKGERESVRELAEAVREGKVTRVSRVSLRADDVRDNKGWKASFKPWPSDRAALELAISAANAGSKATAPSETLPAELLRRAEIRNLPLPWNAEHSAPVFGHVAAPLAPPLQVDRLGGGTLKIQDQKGPMMISFWATWCGPCREELPQLQELSRRIASSGQGSMSLWAISTDDNAKKIEEEVKKLGLEAPVGLANRDAIAAWDIGPIPRLFVLDAEHRVVIDHQGFSSERFGELAAEIEAVARGERKGERELGNLLGQGLELKASGLAGVDIEALAADQKGQLWVAREGDLVELLPLRLEGEALQLDESRAVPMPAVPDQVLWVDLDGDGVEEILSASGRVLRAAKADGSLLWSQRARMPLRDLALIGRGGELQVVALRAPSRLPDEAMLIFMDAAGRILREQDAGGVVKIDGSQLRPDLFALDRSGALLASEGEAPLKELALGLKPLRAFQAIHKPDQPSRLLMAGRGAEEIWGCGTGALLQTAGGDLVGLDEAGDVRFRLDLKRPPKTILADPDRDGTQELIVAAPWFGLGILSAGCKDAGPR